MHNKISDTFRCFQHGIPWIHFIIVMFEGEKIMFAKCFARIILQYVPEGSGSWKYIHYFPVAKGEGKMQITYVNRNYIC